MWIGKAVKAGQAPRLRGGSWNNNPENCRSAIRNNNTPDDRNNNNGFRVVCGSASTLHEVRTDGWESIGRASEESRPVPVMLVTASEYKIGLGKPGKLS
ncbi:MAG: SUMF1/EgtB/PvdO family nonheme iron enzyme [Cyanobacteria bacterium P01_A01_bin.15]